MHPATRGTTCDRSALPFTHLFYSCSLVTPQLPHFSTWTDVGAHTFGACLFSTLHRHPGVRDTARCDDLIVLQHTLNVQLELKQTSLPVRGMGACLLAQQPWTRALRALTIASAAINNGFSRAAPYRSRNRHVRVTSHMHGSKTMHAMHACMVVFGAAQVHSCSQRTSIMHA